MKEEKYVINAEMEELIVQDTVVLMTGEIERVFVLDEIEYKIWKIFDKSVEIAEALKLFKESVINVCILDEDFLEYVNQLIKNNLLVVCEND